MQFEVLKIRKLHGQKKLYGTQFCLRHLLAFFSTGRSLFIRKNCYIIFWRQNLFFGVFLLFCCQQARSETANTYGENIFFCSTNLDQIAIQRSIISPLLISFSRSVSKGEYWFRFFHTDLPLPSLGLHGIAHATLFRMHQLNNIYSLIYLNFLV
jgi:hypothetical protein